MFKELTEQSKEKIIYIYLKIENKYIRFYKIKMKEFINKFIDKSLNNKPILSSIYKRKPLERIRTNFNLIKNNEFICDDEYINLLDNNNLKFVIIILVMMKKKKIKN